MDLESRDKWLEYSVAKDEMFKYTDIKQAPWYVVNSDNKKRARLNTITHLLTMIPLRRSDAEEDRSAQAGARPPRRLHPPADVRPDLRAGEVLIHPAPEAG